MRFAISLSAASRRLNGEMILEMKFVEMETKELKLVEREVIKS